MKRITLLILMLFLPSVYLGHDVDREQKKVKHLKFDNEEFFELWFDYWHERRLLVKDMGEYIRCVGGIQSMYRILGWGEFNGEDFGITTYWDLIPAIPLEEKPGDLDNARAHIEAGINTRSIFQFHLLYCNNHKVILEEYIKNRIGR